MPATRSDWIAVLVNAYVAHAIGIWQTRSNADTKDDIPLVNQNALDVFWIVDARTEATITINDLESGNHIVGNRNGLPLNKRARVLIVRFATSGQKPICSQMRLESNQKVVHF